MTEKIKVDQNVRPATDEQALWDGIAEYLIEDWDDLEDYYKIQVTSKVTRDPQ